MSSEFLLQSTEEVCKDFSVNPHYGITDFEAAKRLKRWGENSLTQQKKQSLPALFIAQFRDFMVLVLLAATLISGLLGEYLDAAAIIIIVLLNAALGFIQEYRAERSLAALKKLAAPKAKVYRGGKLVEIPSRLVVPGDIIVLEPGNRICADIRLIGARNLTVNEAALTGESLPVIKNTLPLKRITSSLGDLFNMVLMGTLIVEGRGKGVVVKTGNSTEMGRIARLIQQSKEESTPLQKRISQLGKVLVVTCFAACLIVVIAGIMQGVHPYKMFMAGVSLAVAAIPEGLPAIVTITLAIGVQRMIRKRAIVRRLPAVETLGCVTVICSDKTGTLTQNKMVVQKIYSINNSYIVKEDGSFVRAHPRKGESSVNPQSEPELWQALLIATLCNNAFLRKKGWGAGFFQRSGEAKWDLSGNPTEGSLLIAAAKAGLWQENEERKRKLVFEGPFSSERKMMSMVYREKKSHCVYVKGAPEVILKRCRYFQDGGEVKLLTEDKRALILKEVEMMAAGTLRNLALAYKRIDSVSLDIKSKGLEDGLIFTGVIGMLDPPRPEVFSATKRCLQAGIRIIMITGDHKNTAIAIAKQLNIFPRGGKVLTGDELEVLNARQLQKEIEECSLFARVNPEHKLRIVNALKQRGDIVAMTGDGVNDAPAVKMADIGIAMGIAGTDVTKEAASLVLADDNFATITAAIEEGRGIFENIRKFIRFLLGCNLGEILTMFVAILIGLPLPLRPIQILWVNLVTDGLPAIALGVDPAARDIMRQPPRNPKEGIFTGVLTVKIIFQGGLIAASTLFVFIYSLAEGSELVYAQTMAFTTLVLTQLIYAFNCRSESKSVRELSVLRNPYLIFAVFSSLFLMVAVIYHPFLQALFRTKGLDFEDWLLVAVISVAANVFSFLFFFCLNFGASD